jgi:outer membrane protein OmpA-like peptidoglycan-associated protein
MGIQIKTEIIPLDIWFGEGKAILKQGPHNSPVLKSLAKKLEVPNLVHIEIEGSPDPAASAETNKEISLRRAEAVRVTIADLFKIPPERIQAASAGAANVSTPKENTSNSDHPSPIYVILYRIDTNG